MRLLPLHKDREATALGELLPHRSLDPPTRGALVFGEVHQPDRRVVLPLAVAAGEVLPAGRRCGPWGSPHVGSTTELQAASTLDSVIPNPIGSCPSSERARGRPRLGEPRPRP